ncbi:TetR family transcriptional regulator [Lactobacillus sp.]|uniref:TetR/AcrR family transcriptional regulator n=1 Tax=Lactobacillus sp. TaxID=1591 RepID=UPI0019BD1E46|nr:TetR family transcriptional regulator [Lactobacillus sp.]MBD5430688.1 TetR family transcriptional regulator [Lactobacillus sp.]
MTKHRTLDKEKVIDKATKIINDDGLSALTMPHLAQELNIRSQSLYHYVANRRELLSLICVKRLQVLHQQLVQKIIGLSGRNALFAFADEIRNFLLNDHAMSSIFYNVDEIGNDSTVKKEVHEIVKLGEKLDVDNKNVVSVHGLLAAVLGYVFLDRSQMFSDETKEQSNDNYHQLLLRLVAPKVKVNQRKTIKERKLAR